MNAEDLVPYKIYRHKLTGAFYQVNQRRSFGGKALVWKFNPKLGYSVGRNTWVKAENLVEQSLY